MNYKSKDNIMDNAENAIKIINENTHVIYGIFGIIDSSGYFPPLDFINEFFSGGSDPCDQDFRMGSWRPFKIDKFEYEKVKLWWIDNHKGCLESTLGCECWDDWIQYILNL